MTSANQEDEFTEVARKRKKHKAISSPTLLTLQKTGSSETPPVTPARPKSSYKNKISVIISGVDKKFQNWRQIIGELKQYHPLLKVSSIKELPKGDFIVFGHSVQNMIILQNESKLRQLQAKKYRLVFLKSSKQVKLKTNVLRLKESLPISQKQSL